MKKLMVLLGIAAVAFGAKKVLGGKEEDAAEYIPQQG
jgi:hypothetical protein